MKRKISTFAEYDELAGWLFRPLEIEPEAWEVLTRDVKHSIQVIGGGLGPAGGPPRVDAGRDQGRPAGPAAHHGRGRTRLPRAAAHRDHRAAVSTGIYESLALLGREESFARYRETLAKLAEIWAAA